MKTIMAGGWVALLLLFSGCVGVNSWSLNDVDKDFQFPENPSYGLIVVSTRYPVEWVGRPTEPEFLMIYDDDNKVSPRGGLIPAMGRLDDKDFSDPPGHLTVRKVAVGTHFIQVAELHDSGYSRGTGGVSFRVEPGKITYLGEFHILDARCFRQLDCPVKVTNQWARDRALLLQKWKKLSLDGYRKPALREESKASSAP